MWRTTKVDTPMANAPTNERIQTSATAIVSGLPGATWDGILIRDDKGACDQKQTQRAFNLALRNVLRSRGEIVSAPRASASSYDLVNITKGVYHAFASQAKGEPAKAGLSEVVYASLNTLGVPFAEMEKAKRIVHGVLTDPNGRFSVAKGATKFAGHVVTLKGAPTPLEPFTKWTETAETAAPSAPVAAPKNGAKKGKGASATA